MVDGRGQFRPGGLIVWVARARCTLNTAPHQPVAELSRGMAAPIPHLIYVHGLFMNGAESLVLRRRLLRDFGAPVHVHAFQYRSVSSGMADITARLQAYVRELAPSSLHLVAHSLGGLVVHRFLERYPDQPPGRVVLTGLADRIEPSRRRHRSREMGGEDGRALCR